MTKNQLEYRAQDEAKRANLAREAETARYNLVLERLKDRELSDLNTRFAQQMSETIRSNLAKEKETSRANQAKEAETFRHNVASLDEVSRHNLATEAVDRNRIDVSLGQLREAIRANQAGEALRQESNRIALSELYERGRSNRANERETHRSNVSRETETRRSNFANEDERFRSNVANETLIRERNTETNRSNLAQEGLNELRYNLDNYIRTSELEVDRGQLRETERNNLVNNVINGMSAVGKLAGTVVKLLS